MTKPLQGALFRKFRDQIMGVVPASDPGPGKVKSVSDKCDTNKDKPTKGKQKMNVGPAKKAVPQECVGKHGKPVGGKTGLTDPTQKLFNRRRLNRSKGETPQERNYG